MSEQVSISADKQFLNDKTVLTVKNQAGNTGKFGVPLACKISAGRKETTARADIIVGGRWKFINKCLITQCSSCIICLQSQPEVYNSCSLTL